MQPSKGIKGIKKHKNINKCISDSLSLRCNQNVTKRQPSKGIKGIKKHKNINKRKSDFFSLSAEKHWLFYFYVCKISL